MEEKLAFLNNSDATFSEVNSARKFAEDELLTLETEKKKIYDDFSSRCCTALCCTVLFYFVVLCSI